MKRRTFLRNAAVTASTLAFSPLWSSAQNKKRLGVALVGLGYYSSDLLAPALQLTQHCYLAGIVTGTPSKAEAWKQRYNIPDKNIYNYENFHQIANNKEIDVVYIVLPPSMHAVYTVKGANAGKHVWCEKPMAMTEAECDRMIKACQTNKVKLSIGYRMHHEPNTQRIMQFAKGDRYGKVLHVEAKAGYFDGRTDHWKQKKSMGGGSMYDMGVYPLNAARYATGLEPISVLAKQSTTRPDIYKEVDETMEFELEFEGGVIARCETSFGKGMNLLKTQFASGFYTLAPFQAYSGINGVTSDGMILNAKIENQQAKQMDDDALAIINNSNVLVPGEEGKRDIKIVEKIYESVSRNQRIQIS